MQIYTSNVLQSPQNVFYPKCFKIKTTDDLKNAVVFDYVAANFTDNKRGDDKFIKSDCVILDIDNASEDKKDWVYPSDLKESFPNVEYWVHFSRNHEKEKNGKKPRPKFHVFFPISETSDIEKYRSLKTAIVNFFPAFDEKAVDASHFFFGTQEPQVMHVAGVLNVDDFIKSVETKTITIFEDKKTSDMLILEGSRNDTLHKKTLALLTRHGESDTAKKEFAKECNRCSPLLPIEEIKAIWASALKFYRNTITQNPSYIPPEDFSALPETPTEAAEAECFTKAFSKEIVFCPAYGFLFFDGKIWNINDLEVRYRFTEFVKKQISSCPKTAGGEQCKKFLIHCLNLNPIQNVLKLSQYKFFKSAEDFDKDPNLLNTPGGVVDLRTGDVRPVRPDDFMTQITTVSISEENFGKWQQFLEDVFCGDKDLIAYVQLVCGAALFGVVQNEGLIISQGDGRNGKSTFWNVISQVLGTYAGSLSSDVFLTNTQRNVKYELAMLKGKRLAICQELNEGVKLDEAILKQITSTDKINAELKFKDCFSFTPSHSIVMHTNHLPEVKSMDEGTWRRLNVIPFLARFNGKKEVKNFASVLVKKCGGAILKWLIEGAVKAFKCDFKFTLPEAVKKTTAAYKKDNDWLEPFIAEKCVKDKEARVQSSLLYTIFCQYNKGPRRTQTAFTLAMKKAGYETVKNSVIFFQGLRIRNEDEDYDLSFHTGGLFPDEPSD